MRKRGGKNGFRNRFVQQSPLLQQNEQLLQHIAAQDKEIKRLLRLLTLCLIFSITSTIVIIILVLLLIQAK
jgi:hypothetical protein